MKRIFISDLHLDERRPDLTGAFFGFLATHCADADELYILGDLFEVWLGDDDASDLNRAVADALQSLDGAKYIMHGNRDFLIGEAFCRAAGARLLADPGRLELPEGPTLLMHGDSLCTGDAAYMKARRLLRSAAFRAQFLEKSLPERARAARQMRGESGRHTRETAADIMDVTPSAVISAMEAANVNTLIHGHTHRPGVHEVALGSGPGRRFVLGDWHTSTRYLEVTEAAMALKTYRFN